MSVTINAKGTSVPSFTIGKAGTTIYQGSVDPVGSNTIKAGDYWLDNGTNALKTRIGGVWLAPELNSLTIPTGVGSAGQSIVTDGTSGILSFANRVSSVSVTTAAGVSGTVATATTTPAITITLGAITPTSVAATGAVTGSNLSGTNTGDQSITLTGDVTGGPSTGSITTTLATVNSNTGSFGSATVIPIITVNAKGLITAVSTATLGSSSANLSGGTTGALPYQSAPNVTAFLAAGTSNQVLIGGASAPSWSGSPSGLTSISATTFTGALTGNASTASQLATARSISISGDGTWTVSFSGSGDVTSALTLATVNAAPQTDTFRKITVNAKGLTTATSAVTAGDITTALNYTPVNKNGDTMTGLLVLSADPSAALGAATKQYVDNIAGGLSAKNSCNTGTTATLAVSSAGTVTYANGTAGVGATLTTTGTFNTIGGFTTANGNRILVKDEAAQANNGIYTRTSATVLTRAADFDNSPPNEIEGGDFTFVSNGTLAGTNWVQTTPAPITVGTTAIVWTQLSGPGTYTAGSGISITGNVIANTGVLSNVAGTGISVSGATGNVTIGNTGVTAITGTANQITASASTGSITLSLPSAVTISGIMSASSFTGAGTGLTGTAASLTIGGSAATLTTTRTFSATGDATAVAQNFNGSQNVALPMLLATVTQSTGANFVKITLDTKGRVTGNTAVAASDITPLINATYVLKAGDTMTGSLVNNVGFTARTATSAHGYINVLPGSATISGLIEFMAITSNTRQGYIGATGSNSTVDAGIIPYVAGTHSFSGAATITTTTGSTNTLTITDTGVNGANIKFTGPGTNPSKTIRANAGVFEVINNAYSTAILTLTDAGALTVPGLATVSGLRSIGNNNVDIVATSYASNQPARGLRLLGGTQWVSGLTLESDAGGIASMWLNIHSDDIAGTYKAIGLFRNTTVFNIAGAEKMRLHSDGALLVNQTTSDGVSKIQVTGSGTSSANPIVAIQQVSNRLWFNAKAATGWNSLIQTDDQVIISQAPTVDTGALTIGTWTGNATGIRITPTTVALSGSTSVSVTSPTFSISGVVATSLGTALLPSHTFATDLDTGIYSPGANQVAITVAGAQVVNFLSTGLDMNGGHMSVGDAGISANALINGVETYAPDATRYGTLMDVTIDNTVPIIANRVYYGNQAIVKVDLSDVNRAGFTVNSYGAYLETRFGTVAGGESAITTGTGARNYVQNWAATGIATDLRGTWSNILHSNALSNASSYAAYNHVQLSSTATGTVDNAYGTYNRLDQDAGTLTRAYGIFNSFEGTIGRKIGMYSGGGTSLDVAAASTVPLTFGHYSAGSDLVLPRLTFDTAGIATFGSNVIINTGASTSTQSLAVINTGTNGSNILITGNGATTPNKYIRVQSGVFQIINSAYASPILAITDAGVLTTPSILDANLTGIPVAPTAALGTSTTQVATTAFVRTNSGLFTVSPPPAPSSPSPGDRWLSTDSGRIYTYFNDGDSSQWAEFAGDAGIVANGVTIPVINPPTPKEGDYRIVGGVLSFWIAGAWVQSIPAIYA